MEAIFYRNNSLETCILIEAKMVKTWKVEAAYCDDETHESGLFAEKA